jgi:hypothetical protein
MMILGGVPISVIMPPRIEANDRGINESAGLLLAFVAACMSTGISNARAATLFINADNTAASDDMMPICAASFLVFDTTNRASSSMAPELDRPRLTISTSAIMTTAECPNPENAWSVGITPASNATINAKNATRS